MPLQILESVPSTMDIARENLASGQIRYVDSRLDGESYGVLTREQTSGRGQRGRVWFAPAGQSLCATFYYPRAFVSAAEIGEISLLAGAAVAETLAEICASSGNGTPVGLKWANDVLLNGRKVSGILTEMVKTPEGQVTAIIGIGINVTVKSFPPEIAGTATSLLLEGVNDVNIETFALNIAAQIRELSEVREQDGFAAVLSRWRRFDATARRRYETEIGGETLIGTASGIADSGALQLRLDSGRVLEVISASSLREVFAAGSFQLPESNVTSLPLPRF